ncbi:hypothetical protein G5714_004583 [Onychostoma macrolepis]|uniref:Uncharacterized protein n=1 Tax=Onychostoma macrolepis TaxID=369639 RepID=A0A7J6D531_9TELE|nr:hypothetical protein G5714_004583 [Onychostoma macrolepis]
MVPVVDRRRVTALYLLLKNLRKRRRRRIWVHPINQRRRQFGAFHHLVTELRLDDDRHLKYFRMSAEQMDELLSVVGPELARQSTNYRAAIEPKQRLAITLRFLGTGESFSSLALQYRLGTSTVSGSEASRATKLRKPIQGALTVPCDSSRGPVTLRFRRPTCNLSEMVHGQGGLFSADRGRYGHGTPDTVLGDRDVMYTSISGRSDLSVSLSAKHLKINGISYTRQQLPFGPWGS